MDKGLIYHSIYNRIFQSIETRIKKKLEKDKKNKRTYGICVDEIRVALNEISNKKLLLYQHSKLKSIAQLFNRRFSLYTENQESLILENEIYTEFKNINEIEFPRKYSFQRLIFELAFSNALHEAERLITNNNSLYDLIYDYNELDRFELTAYDSEVTSTPLFIELNKKRYPTSKIAHEDATALSESGEMISINGYQINKSKITTNLKILLIEELINLNCEWSSIDKRKRARILGIITGANVDNIRQRLDITDKKPSDLTEHERKLQKVAEDIINTIKPLG